VKRINKGSNKSLYIELDSRKGGKKRYKKIQIRKRKEYCNHSSKRGDFNKHCKHCDADEKMNEKH